MLSKIRQASKYLLYALVSNIVFGLIYYFVFTWLMKYSPLYAYLGSLVLIIIGVAFDRYTHKMYDSELLATELMSLKPEDKEKNYRFIKWQTESFISFKTTLFVFYFFILIFSQIITIDPTLVGKEISEFILANSYGIVLLIAFDRMTAQFLNDRYEMQKNAEKVKKYFE